MINVVRTIKLCGVLAVAAALEVTACSASTDNSATHSAISERQASTSLACIAAPSGVDEACVTKRAVSPGSVRMGPAAVLHLGAAPSDFDCPAGTEAFCTGYQVEYTARALGVTSSPDGARLAVSAYPTLENVSRHATEPGVVRLEIQEVDDWVNIRIGTLRIVYTPGTDVSEGGSGIDPPLVAHVDVHLDRPLRQRAVYVNGFRVEAFARETDRTTSS